MSEVQKPVGSRSRYHVAATTQLRAVLVDQQGRARGPNCDAVRHNLTWTHYRLLLRVDKPEARGFDEAEAVNASWFTRELDQRLRHGGRDE